MGNRKTFYLIITIIFLVLVFVGGLFLEISNGNPQKSKYHYIFQKYYLKKKIDSWPKNYNGLWNDWGKKGFLDLATKVENGAMNGEQLGYFNNSLVLSSKQNFKNNHLHGEQEYFSINGNLSQKTYFENGVEIGPSICFFESGKVETKKEFKVDTNESTYRIYYENGIKRVEGHFQNKQPLGEWLFWDEKGIETKKVNINSENEKKEIIIFLYDLKANK